LTQYLIQGAAQYGMEPGEFIKVIDQNGQIPGMVGEVARSKALSVALSKAKVVDSKGKAVDLTAFTAAAVAPVADGISAEGTIADGISGDDHAGHDH
jgi:trigger factor